ncbi:MAG: helix-turn-helix domain-containing protein [Capsulimonas sp.]|uniref:winged helix-turn-helix transcriptional regulator n=1 Tax=Capsulimonas sp. TaxID=2494211 RepID=UPI0032651DE3
MDNRKLLFNCPVEAALEAIGGKWKPVIVWHLSQHDFRSGELRRAIPRVTEKVMIEQLRQLERSGVVARQVTETIPPAVTYSLTEHGRRLKDAIGAVSDWGLHHAEVIGARILIIDQSCDAPRESHS